MDIIGIAIQNAHIDAQARRKAAQAKARNTDKTRRARAQQANIMAAVDRPVPQVARPATRKTVTFGPYAATGSNAGKPLKGILKAPRSWPPLNGASSSVKK